ncbi:MAG: VIT domain-containing protein [Gemmatimonadaceae bacterium]
MRAAFVAVAFLISPLAALRAQLERPIPCRPPRCAPGGAFVVRGPTTVRAELADRVVRYEVTERFVNRGSGIAEADYLFPLPRNGAFQDLKLEIDGELVSGETLNADEARRVYEDIVRRQRDPALVEWMGHGLLRTRIFPIQPGQERRVVVRFHVVPEREGGSLRVDWFRGSAPQPRVPQGRPTPMEDRAGDDRDDDPERPRSSFTLLYPGDQYGRPYSPTHELTVRDDTRGRRRVEVRGDAKDVTVLLPVRLSDQPAVSVLPHAPGGEPGFALVTLTPPTEAARRRSIPRDVTLVLDVSGSMSGRKLEQAKAAGKQLLATLSPADRFRIVDFSTDVRSFRDGWARATAANVRAARQYLDDLEAQGSTNIEGALRAALQPGRLADDEEYVQDRLEEPRAMSRVPFVLFVTDGEPTVGARSPEALARIAAERRGGARLFTFGVGSDVSVPLVERLALEGRGTAHFVRPEESVERVLAVVASRITSPVVTDLTVRAEGPARLRQILPAGPIDLFAGQDLVLLARYTGSGDVRIRFEGRVGDEPVVWTSTARLPERDRGNAFVARLWATQRVGWLSAEKRKNGGSPEIDDEIRLLGERFGIPTEFTSYFVKEPGMVAADVVSPRGRRIGEGAVQLQGVVTTSASANAATPPPAAPSAREREFSAAKDAAGQRAATSLAAVDSAAAASLGDAGGARTRRAGGRVFVKRGEVWTDAAHKDSTRIIKVKAFSAAYFALLEIAPALREPLALGERVLVAGSGVSVEVGAAGVEALSASDRAAIEKGW